MLQEVMAEGQTVEYIEQDEENALHNMLKEMLIEGQATESLRSSYEEGG